VNAEPASAPRFAPLDVRFPRSRDEQFEAFVADIGPYLLRVARAVDAHPRRLVVPPRARRL